MVDKISKTLVFFTSSTQPTNRSTEEENKLNLLNTFYSLEKCWCMHFVFSSEFCDVPASMSFILQKPRSTGHVLCRVCVCVRLANLTMTIVWKTYYRFNRMPDDCCWISQKQNGKLYCGILQTHTRQKSQSCFKSAIEKCEIFESVCEEEKRKKECLCEIGWDFEREEEIDKRQPIRKKLVRRTITFQREYRSSRDEPKQRQQIPENEQHWIIHEKKKRIALTTTTTSEYASIATQHQQQHFVWKSRSNGRNSYRLWKSNGRHHAHTYTHNWRRKK